MSYISYILSVSDLFLMAYWEKTEIMCIVFMMTLPVVYADNHSLVRLLTSYDVAAKTLDFYHLRPVPQGFVNLTPYTVSNSMVALLSYGPKFMLPNVTSILDIVEDFGKMYSYLQKTYGVLDPSQIFLELFHNHRREVAELFQGRTLGAVELAIKHAMADVHNFFKIHPDTCLVQSDKGNKTCLMLCLDYRDKMQQYVDKSLSEGVLTYATDVHLRVATSSFVRLRTDLRKLLDKTPWVSRIPKKLLDNIISTRVSTATLPTLYGMVKCHKKDSPMRPICSTLHWLSRPIQKLLLWILKDYFSDRLCPQNVLRIDEVARDLASLRVRPGYCFAKFDICNMYGSLDKDKIEKMLKTFLSNPEIERREVLSSDMVLRLLRYSLHLSALVSYGGITYKQSQGLPQGACDSGFLATLYVDTILQVHNEELFLAHKVLHFWKFMDDMLLYMPLKFVPFFRLTFERITGLELELELPDPVTEGSLHQLGVRSTISFLDIRINVMSDNTLTTSAYRKPTSSARMIHALSTTINEYKVNVLTQYLKKILRRSSNAFILHDFNALYARALENSYPASMLDHLFYKTLEKELISLSNGCCYLNLQKHQLQERIAIIEKISSSLQCGGADIVQELRAQHVSLTPQSRVVFPFRSVSFSRLLRLACQYGGIPLPVYSRGNQSGYLSRFYANRRLSTIVDSVSRDSRFFRVGLLRCMRCDMVFVISGRTKLDKIADAQLSDPESEIVQHQDLYGHIVSPVVHRLRNIQNVDVAYTSLIYKALFNAVGVSCSDQQLLSQLPIYLRCLLGYMQGLGAFDVNLPDVSLPSLPSLPSLMDSPSQPADGEEAIIAPGIAADDERQPLIEDDPSDTEKSAERGRQQTFYIDDSDSDDGDVSAKQPQQQQQQQHQPQQQQQQQQLQEQQQQHQLLIPDHLDDLFRDELQFPPLLPPQQPTPSQQQQQQLGETHQQQQQLEEEDQPQTLSLPAQSTHDSDYEWSSGLDSFVSSFL